MTLYILGLLIVLPLTLSQTPAPQFQILETPLGTVMGVRLSLESGTVYQFRNIPYAKPPVGPLRFQKPVPMEPWSNMYDSSMFGPSCIQDIPKMYIDFLQNKNMSEDCLSLNVYTSGELSPRANRSVMVWFHGGAYVNGQAQLYDGSPLAIKGNVVVVTANYRLGVLGFFSTGDSVAKGNYGLWDQIEVLKWVQKNIRSFGGNPNSVTIFGESAGGFSVSLLSFIPETRGLFQRIIMQSGAFNSPYAVCRNPKDFAVRFSYISKCKDILTSKAMYDCVRELSTRDVLKAQNTAMRLSMLSANSLFALPLGPVIDMDLIKSEPTEIAGNTSSAGYEYFRSLDVMAGCVNAEGSLLTFTVFPYMAEKMGFNASDGVPTSVLKSYFARTVSEQLYNNHSNVWRAIVDKFGSSDMAVQARKIVDLYGDMFFYLPMIRTVDLHAANNTASNTFQYLFSERSPRPLFGSSPPWFRGAEHAAELAFLFGIEKLKYVNITPSEAQLHLSDDMITYWTNFAKFGDPNTGGGARIRWPNYDTESRTYINLASRISQQVNMFGDRVKFWEKDLPLIASRDVASATGTSLVATGLLVGVVCLGLVLGSLS